MVLSISIIVICRSAILDNSTIPLILLLLVVNNTQLSVFEGDRTPQKSTARVVHLWKYSHDMQKTTIPNNTQLSVFEGDRIPQESTAGEMQSFLEIFA